MDTITLREGYNLRMEPCKKKVRIIITRDNEEYVCRMETMEKLKAFAALKEANIFKGRLQLYKEAGLINVVVKNKAAGIIDENSFDQCLDAVRW